MDDQSKSKEQLASELQTLRKRVAELESIYEEQRNKEEKYRQLFQTMAQGVIYQDSSGKITSANPAAERLLGLTVDQMQMRTSVDPRWQAIHEDGSEFLWDTHPSMVALRTGKQINNVIMGVYHPIDDASRWISIDAVPQFNPGEDKPYQVYTTFSDITERKLAEQALRLQGEIMANVSEGVNLVRAEDRAIIYTNPRFEEMLGYSPGEMLGKNISIVNAPTDKSPEETAKNIFAILEKTGSWRGEVNNITKDGTPFWCYASVSVFEHHDHGKVLVSVHTDITERKRAEVEKEKLTAQLYQADKMTTIGLLAAGLAHEINNPIGFVLPNLQFLREHFALMQEIVNLHEGGAPESKIAEFRRANNMDTVMKEIPQMLSDCLDGARRVRDTTRELRQFSRMDDAEAEKVDLSDLLDSSLIIAANEIKYRAKVIKRYSDIPDVVVNRGKMSQVFLNLLVNAGQAIEEGHVQDNWIRVATGQEDDKVFVEIANSGPPIPPEILPKIFDPFFTTKSHEQGTGLGLSISYSIVQQHGGVILVESTAEQGTVFKVWLPQNTRLETRTVEASAFEAENVRPGRILIVDDEEAILRFLRITLEPLHFVVSTTSGKEALEILANDQSFDVILCDLMMPEISGMELFVKVQSDYPQLSARFIFMTGGAFTPRAGEFVKRVNNLVLEKPVELDELRSAVNILMAEQQSIKLTGDEGKRRP